MMHIGDDFSRLTSFDALTPDQESVLNQMRDEIEIERSTSIDNDAEIELMFSMYEHGQLSVEF